MAQTSENELVSKYTAIKYGMLIAGIVLLLVATVNWYYNTVYLVQMQAKYACPQTVLQSVTPQASTFASDHKLHRDQKNGKLSENMIAEGFLSYKADQSPSNFASMYDGQTDDQDASIPYDPSRDSLEQSVFDSHKEFVDESNLSTQGPNSGNVERDDTNEVVKRWGLRRVEYEVAQSGDDARVVSSEYPDQVAQNTENTVL